MTYYSTDDIEDKYKDAYKNYLISLHLSELLEKIECPGKSINDTLIEFITEKDPTGNNDLDFYDIRNNL